MAGDDFPVVALVSSTGGLDGDPLRPGRILVAPSGRHTLVRPGLTLALIPSGPVPPYRPSADLLLTTLAVAAGPRAVAVVLTGKGSDAATGATAVQHFGGRVLVSSPGSSAEPSMPQATIDRDHGVHLVVDLDALAQALITLATGHPAGHGG
jgi:two-component system, chemotaxis family, protein-glutamate methylesterase/glutaminase